MSDSLQPHGLQLTRLPCSSLSPGVCSNSCPLNRGRHPTLSFCHPLLLLPSLLPSIRVFSMSRLFASGDQRFGASTSASLLSVNIQGWFPLGLTDLIHLLFKGLSHHSLKASILLHSDFFIVQLLHPYMTTGKTIALTRWTFVGKEMFLPFNMICCLGWS